MRPRGSSRWKISRAIGGLGDGAGDLGAYGRLGSGDGYGQAVGGSCGLAPSRMLDGSGHIGAGEALGCAGCGRSHAEAAGRAAVGSGAIGKQRLGSRLVVGAGLFFASGCSLAVGGMPALAGLGYGGAGQGGRQGAVGAGGWRSVRGQAGAVHGGGQGYQGIGRGGRGQGLCGNCGGEYL